MKAISLWQPWASLIACGAKPFETRSWCPPFNIIGSHIAIHAAKKIDKDAAEFAGELMFGQHATGGFELADKLHESMSKTPHDLEADFGETVMPIGCVVATARLTAAFLLGEPAEGSAYPAASTIHRHSCIPIPDCFTIRYDDFGDYSPGRWAWYLTDVVPVNPPAPVKGRQGFFDLPQGWLTQ